MTQKRQPKGKQTGGQFAPDVNQESTVVLSDESVSAPRDYSREAIDEHKATILDAEQNVESTIGSFAPEALFNSTTRELHENMETIVKSQKEIIFELESELRESDRQRAAFSTWVNDAIATTTSVRDAESRDVMTLDADGDEHMAAEIEEISMNGELRGLRQAKERFDGGASSSSNGSSDILEKPLTAAQIKERLDSDGFVTGRVLFDLDDAVHLDLDSFYDRLSERLVGSSLGMDIGSKVVGSHEGSIVLEVSLDPSMVLETGGDD